MIARSAVNIQPLVRRSQRIYLLLQFDAGSVREREREREREGETGRERVHAWSQAACNLHEYIHSIPILFLGVLAVYKNLFPHL